MKATFALLLIWVSPLLMAQTEPDCIEQQLNAASGAMLVAELKKLCDIEVRSSQRQGALEKRFSSESITQHNPYVLTPHRKNYILPISYSNRINSQIYQQQQPTSGWGEHIEPIEVKYQLSIKVPVNYDDIALAEDKLYFALTMQSWWQLYAEGISKPFRETNYKPELFYLAPFKWRPFGSRTGFTFGIEHQSNGRSTALSRSWNRLYTGFIFAKGDLALLIKPWYRLKEDQKAFIGDPKGDDNPDIERYMGHFESHIAYQHGRREFSLMFRNNFATHKGALELGVTFPLRGRLRGYIQAFSGYGESLIDYNHNQTRIGVGFTLNNNL